DSSGRPRLPGHTTPPAAPEGPGGFPGDGAATGQCGRASTPRAYRPDAALSGRPLTLGEPAWRPRRYVIEIACWDARRQQGIAVQVHLLLSGTNTHIAHQHVSPPHWCVANDVYCTKAFST